MTNLRAPKRELRAQPKLAFLWKNKTKDLAPDIQLEDSAATTAPHHAFDRREQKRDYNRLLPLG